MYLKRGKISFNNEMHSYIKLMNMYSRRRRLLSQKNREEITQRITFQQSHFPGVVVNPSCMLTKKNLNNFLFPECTIFSSLILFFCSFYF